MANQFSITPAGDMSRGLAGLSSVLENVRVNRQEAAEKREAQAKAEAEAAKQQEIMAQAQEIFGRGDVREIARFSIDNPELGKNLRDALGLVSKADEQEQADLFVNTLTDLKTPGGVQSAVQRLQAWAQKVSERGGDPSSSLKALQQLSSGDPQQIEAYRQATRNALAGLAPDRSEAFEKIYGEPQAKKRDIVQVFPKQGESYTAFVTPDGTFSDMRGNPLELDDSDRVVEGSTLSGSEKDLGLSKTEIKELRGFEIATMDFLDTTEEALTLLEETPDINTFTARAAATVNNLQQEALAVGRALGVDIDEALIMPEQYEGTFDDLGIENQRMRSMITSLAFQAAAASGQTGREVSDKDVTRFIQEIGASAADPRAFSKTLKDVANRSIKKVQNQYRVKLNEEYEGSLLDRVYTDEPTRNEAGVIVLTDEDSDKSLDELGVKIGDVFEYQGKQIRRKK